MQRYITCYVEFGSTNADQDNLLSDELSSSSKTVGALVREAKRRSKYKLTIKENG